MVLVLALVPAFQTFQKDPQVKLVQMLEQLVLQELTVPQLWWKRECKVPTV
jgi:hypothetical protein